MILHDSLFDFLYFLYLISLFNNFWYYNYVLQLLKILKVIVVSGALWVNSLPMEAPHIYFHF